uniref:Site-specific DNA-methyltransferase n=1 Tax=uncultured marine virus TaxID=186617 RepID=A0A0F7L3S5_9VIRU|nr:site-specific DNA-methyltransferase [uncultured marine virus]
MCRSSPLCTLSSHRSPRVLAIIQTLSLRCGALTAQAGSMYAPTAKPSFSKSESTCSKTSPSFQLTRPPTFSPTT